MGGGTGCLPGRDVFYPGFKNCLYGRRDGMFAGTGRCSSRVYMRIFLPRTISLGTICKVSIISSGESGTKCLCDKNCPALAGISVERTGIPLFRDGTKNVPEISFHINGMGQIRDIQYTRMARSRLTSRPSKRPVPPPI